MKIKILFAVLLTLALFIAAHGQTPDKAKLDRFFDRLAEKNKAMGSLVVARDGNVLYARAVGYSRISGAEKKPVSALPLEATAADKFRIESAGIVMQFDAAKNQLTLTRRSSPERILTKEK